MRVSDLPPQFRAQAEQKLAAQPRRRGADRVPRTRRGEYAPSTPVGRLLWHIKVEGLPEPKREHRFHPKRMWRFDMAWLDQMVAVEVDGLTHEGGRHQRVAGYDKDCRKCNEAQLMGWTVLHFTQDMIRRGDAIDTLKRVFPKATGGDR